MSQTITGAEYVISRIGGLTRVANLMTDKTGERMPVTTVQGWRDRNRIPQSYWMDLVEFAAANGKPVTLADFLVDHSVDDDETNEVGGLMAATA